MNRLGSRTKVTLAWVPENEGYRGNVKADELARTVSSAGGQEVSGRYKPTFPADLPSRDRKFVSCTLRMHMSSLRLTEETVYRFCQAEEETVIHVLCDCTALAGIRLSEMGSEYPKTETYIEGSAIRLLGLVM
ncbi:hypothetical protein Trydic_g2679 [Trypoxylus dichotomus]